MYQINKHYKNLFGSNIDLLIVNGDITQLNGIDAIVMPTGAHFQHHGGCSRAIVQAAGPQIISDFDNYLKQHSYLDFGTVFSAYSYSLAQSCSTILAVRSPDDFSYLNTFIPVNGKQLNLLEHTFNNLIHKTFNEMNFKSFATPLIGTGINRIPVTSCIKDLITSISNYAQELTNSLTNIPRNVNRKILVVDNQPNNINDLSAFIRTNFDNFEPEKQQQAQQVQNSSQKNSASNDSGSESKTDPKDENCVICMDIAGKEANTFAKKLDKCGHVFCNTCIDDYFKNVKKQCPVCGYVYGVVYGNQPDGTMRHTIINHSLPGYGRNTRTIQIDYNFSGGIQGPNHPNPGRRYSGTSRTAYLPDTPEGKRVLDLLKKSFDLKHTFTIGTSRTTGAENVVTWNDIHHKTSMTGGTANFGYPDPTYINRVINELAAKGIH